MENCNRPTDTTPSNGKPRRRDVEMSDFLPGSLDRRLGLEGTPRRGKPEPERPSSDRP